MASRDAGVTSLIAILIAIALPLCAGCKGPAVDVEVDAAPIVESKATAPERVLVLAAASLTESVNALEEAAEAELGADVVLSFGGSQALRTAIEMGTAADVFISANTEHIDALREADLISGDFEFAHNHLAMIVPSDNPAGIEGLADLAEAGVRVVMAIDTCPVGRYTHELLAACDESGEFGPDFATRTQANIISEEMDVKQVLAKVQLGTVDAGFVYVSDLTEDVRHDVTEVPIPAGVQQQATYALGIPATAENPDGGRRFVEYLLSEAGRDAVTQVAPIKFIESATPPWIDG